MPGFPDKFMPFMDAPPGSLVSGTASMAYGSVIRSLRNITLKKTDTEPKWRHKGRTLTTGYKPSW
jgi:hydrogenase small subunit